MAQPRRFMRSQQDNGRGSSGNRPKWFNSPVDVHLGSLETVRSFLPQFERRSFALTQPDNDCSRLNERLDVIVRKPFKQDDKFIPVGVVSKEYALVSHTSVVDEAERALVYAKIDLQKVKAVLVITEYGERMVLSIYLPDEYAFDPGDGHPMALRLECFNSVDGSSRFRVIMGWFRFVCSNGLVIGVTSSDMKRRHISGLDIRMISKILVSGVKEATVEKKNLQEWRKISMEPMGLVGWTNKNLKTAWGFKAAARFYNIIKTGHDADIMSYCQMLCMALGGDPVFNNSVNKAYSPDDFCEAFRMMQFDPSFLSALT